MWHHHHRPVIRHQNSEISTATTSNHCPDFIFSMAYHACTCLTVTSVKIGLSIGRSHCNVTKPLNQWKGREQQTHIPAATAACTPIGASSNTNVCTAAGRGSCAPRHIIQLCTATIAQGCYLDSVLDCWLPQIAQSVLGWVEEVELMCGLRQKNGRRSMHAKVEGVRWREAKEMGRDGKRWEEVGSICSSHKPCLKKGHHKYHIDIHMYLRANKM